MIKSLLIGTLSFFIAISPIVVLGLYIYNKDKNKEPKKVIAKMFAGGLLSAVATICITFILRFLFPGIDKVDDYRGSMQLFLYSFCFISLVGVLIKWLIVYFFSYKDKEFDELYDMIVYSIFVALGFACAQNLFYIYNYGLVLGVVKMFSSIPSHAAIAIFMGYFLALSKLAFYNGNLKKYKKYMALSIFAPAFLHGTYDYFLFLANPVMIYIFLIFITVLYIMAYHNIRELADCNIELKEVKCPYCGADLKDKVTECPSCGKNLE